MSIFRIVALLSVSACKPLHALRRFTDLTHYLGPGMGQRCRWQRIARENDVRGEL